MLAYQLFQLSLTSSCFPFQESQVATNATKPRAEIVCIPYAFIPGLDLSSRAYHRAVQITSSTKSVNFTVSTTEDSVYSLLSLYSRTLFLFSSQIPLSLILKVLRLRAPSCSFSMPKTAGVMWSRMPCYLLVASSCRPPMTCCTTLVATVL